MDNEERLAQVLDIIRSFGDGGHPKFYQEVLNCCKLYGIRSRGYSNQADPNHNFRAAAKFGVEPWRGVVVRLNDKVSRIGTLSGKAPLYAAEREAIIEELQDIVNYGLIAITLMRPFDDGSCT
ncbi:MAG: hypothetical protein J3T61_00555 [Candidatus Brocadiales bacterium]|nr:hypothetical protein [Candidatus Bathyanammoxibius sp.]